MVAVGVGLGQHLLGAVAGDVSQRVSTTLLNDINDRGQSTGQAFDAADPRNTHYVFLRERDGTITTLPDAPGAAQTISGSTTAVRPLLPLRFSAPTAPS
jgi:hypothetical protein